MGEGDRVEWLYLDYWRERWKLGVAPAVYFGCFMSLMTVEREGFGIGLLLGGFLGGTGFGAWTAWQRDKQWPQAKDLTLGGRRKVLRGLRSGTSPEEAHLARVLLDRVEAHDQLRHQDGLLASAERFEQTTFGAVIFPLIIVVGSAVFALVEFDNGHPIAGTTMAVLATGIGVAVVSDRVRRLRESDADTRRAAAVEAAQELLAAEATT